MGEWTGMDVRLVWSIALALRASLVFDDPRRRVLSPTALSAGIGFAVLGYIRLHFGTAELPADDLTGAYRTVLYFVAGSCGVYSVLKLANSRGRTMMLAGAASFALIVSGGFGLLQAATGYGSDIATGRISGTMGNANYYAAYLSLGATLAILTLRLGMGSRRLHLFAGGVGIATCVLTFSRMGIVACFLGAGLALLVRPKGPVFHWRLIAAAAGIGVVAVLFSATYLADTRRGVSLSKDPSVEQAAQFGQAINDWSRLEAVQYAMDEWIDHPVWGVGVATLAARNYMANGIYVTTHNTYVQVLAGTGVAGAALCGLALFSLLSRVARAGAKRYVMPAAAGLGLCCFFADFLGSIEIFMLMAILLAMLRPDLASSGITSDPASATPEMPNMESGIPAAAL
jgi:hypothetical protein